MDLMISLLDQLRTVLRSAYVVVLVAAGLLALLAWLARARHISPFSPLGRFTRKVTEPLLAPVDRMILRAGGTATATPWWAWLFVVLMGAAAIFVVTALRNALFSFSVASSHGAGGLLRLAVAWAFGLLQLALVVRVITSWIGGTFTWFGRAAHGLTEWFLAPLRNVLPPLGGFDLSPLVAWFLLAIVQGVVMSAF